MIGTLVVAMGLTGILTGLSSEFPTSYTIDVRLDTSEHKIYGKQTVRFMNPTAESLDKIAFNLYPNAFADTNTVYCSENKKTRGDVASGNISRLDVSEVTVSGRLVDTSSIEISETLMYISLGRPVPPGREVEISMNFELLIPRSGVRFGHDGDGNYLLAHWYPILCGFQKGKLIDRKYHANSEFFSNFGSYDVTMKLPSDFIAGSTGNLELIGNYDTLSTWNVTADSVIDFAFACGRNFRKFESGAQGIGIDYLLTVNDTTLLERIDSITKHSLAYCSERLFAFPYSKFTVVDFDSGSPGLELPGMIIVSIDQPRRASEGSMLESLFAHEIAHEWFYATIASNETDQPWLDEGFATFFKNHIMESIPNLKPEFSIFGYGFGYEELSRIISLSLGTPYPIDLASYEYPGWNDYESAVYARASMVLLTLEKLIGDSLFADALKNYAVKYRFGHPDCDDFKDTISSFTELDLMEFYYQFVSGTARVDYAVSGLKYVTADAEEDRYKVTVELVRRFDGLLPQTLSVALQDGSIIDTLWDGRARVATFEFETDSRPVYAAIDQYFVSPLDEKYANNRLYVESQWARMISFDWDSAFIIEAILSLLL